ncbi:MAG: AAA family ATPase, partial [Deltaproteobacteria bacterium]|nr:AAA family ATPase [Deltaproteobacteria bacterium]
SSLELVQIYQEYKDKLPCENEFNFLLSVKKMQHEKIELWDRIPSSLEIIDMDEDADFEWIVHKLIPKGGITLLYGRGGVGKTWLVLQMCEAIASGKPFCGLETKKCPIVYVDFEDSRKVIKKRLNVLGGSKDFKIWLFDSEFPPPKLDSSKWHMYQELPPNSLIVVDTLRAAHALDENSSQDMTKIMDKLKELRRREITVLLLHHAPKANVETYKGSTAILDLVDHELCLEKLEDEDNEAEIYRLGTKLKTRFEPTEIFLSFNGQGFELAQDPRMQKIYDLFEIIKEMGEPLQQDILKEAKEQLGWSKNKTLQILKKGEGTFWRKQKGQGHKFYYIPLERASSNFPLYNIKRKLENSPHKAGKYPKENQEKTLTSSEFSNFPEGSGKIGKYSGKYSEVEDRDEDFEYDL